MLEVKKLKDDKLFCRHLEYIMEEIYINYATIYLMNFMKSKITIYILQKALEICHELEYRDASIKIYMMLIIILIKSYK